MKPDDIEQQEAGLKPEAFVSLEFTLTLARGASLYEEAGYIHTLSGARAFLRQLETLKQDTTKRRKRRRKRKP